MERHILAVTLALASALAFWPRGSLYAQQTQKPTFTISSTSLSASSKTFSITLNRVHYVSGAARVTVKVNSTNNDDDDDRLYIRFPDPNDPGTGTVLFDFAMEEGHKTVILPLSDMASGDGRITTTIEDAGDGSYQVGPDRTRVDSFTSSVLNARPMGVDDLLIISEDDGMVTGDVLTNDYHPFMAAMFVTGFGPGISSAHTPGTQAPGSHGRLTLNRDGSFVYVPDADVQTLSEGKARTDIFSYVVETATNRSSGITLTFVIEGANDAPVLTELPGANKTVMAATASSPGDPNGMGAFSYADMDGDDMAFGNGGVIQARAGSSGPWRDGVAAGNGVQLPGAYGSLFLKADGTWTYQLDNNNVRTRALASGATETDPFSVRIDNGDWISANRHSNAIDINITVNGPADATVPQRMVALPDQTAYEDEMFSYAIDTEPFETLLGSSSIVFGATLANGSQLPGWLSFPGTATAFSGRPSQADVGTLDIRVTGTDMLNPIPSSETAAFQLHVQGVNDRPVLALAGGADTQVTEESGTAAGDLNANGSFTYADADVADLGFGNGGTLEGRAVQGGTMEVVNWQVGSNTANGNRGTRVVGTYGSLYFKAGSGGTASWTYGLDNGVPATKALGDGASAMDRFSFRIDDGAGVTDNRYSALVPVNIGVTGASDRGGDGCAIVPVININPARSSSEVMVGDRGRVFVTAAIATDDRFCTPYVYARVKSPSLGSGLIFGRTMLNLERGRYDLLRENLSFDIPLGSITGEETATVEIIAYADIPQIRRRPSDDLYRLGATYSYTLTLFSNRKPDAGPTGKDITEDETASFTAVDMAFTDRDPGDSLQSVTITRIPDAMHGRLTLGSSEVTGTLTIPVGDIGSLVFHPTNRSTSYTASFGYTVSDGTDDSNEASMEIRVTADNEAPRTMRPVSLSISDREKVIFGPSNFPFMDEDIDDSLQSVTLKFILLNVGSTLMLNGVEAKENDVISVDDLDKLVFTPGPSHRGYTVGFNFQVSDGKALSNPDGLTIFVNHHSPEFQISSFTSNEFVEGETGATAGMATLNVLWPRPEFPPLHLYVQLSGGNFDRYYPIQVGESQPSLTVPLEIPEGMLSGKGALLGTLRLLAPNEVPQGLMPRPGNYRVFQGRPDASTLSVFLVNSIPPTIIIDSLPASIAEGATGQIKFRRLGQMVLGTQAHFRVVSTHFNQKLGVHFSGGATAASVDLSIPANILTADEDATLTILTEVEAMGLDPPPSEYRVGMGARGTGKFTLVNMREPPTAIPPALTITEDDIHAFTVDDFGFSDGDTHDRLESLTVKSLPDAAHGALKLLDASLAVDDVVSRDDLENGRFTFDPINQRTGFTAAFMFTLYDGADSSPETQRSIVVVGDSDPPRALVPLGKRLRTGESVDFARADFPFEDDDEADSLQSITIKSLPDAGHGVLTLGGTAVKADDDVPRDDLDNLKFKAGGGRLGGYTATFNYKVSDGTLLSSNTAGFNIFVDHPSPIFGIGSNVSAEFVEGEMGAIGSAEVVVDGTFPEFPSMHVYMQLSGSGFTKHYPVLIPQSQQSTTAPLEIPKNALSGRGTLSGTLRLLAPSDAPLGADPAPGDYRLGTDISRSILLVNARPSTISISNLPTRITEGGSGQITFLRQGRKVSDTRAYFRVRSASLDRQLSVNFANGAATASATVDIPLKSLLQDETATVTLLAPLTVVNPDPPPGDYRVSTVRSMGTVLLANVQVPPQAMPVMPVIAEEQTHSFQLADFGFVAGDTGDRLETLTIKSLPDADHGVLALGGTAVAVDDDVTRGDLDRGRLIFTPVNRLAGYDASFNFTLSDGAASSTETTMTIGVAADNDPPVLRALLADVSVTEGDTFRLDLESNVFDDPDAGDSLTFAAQLLNDDGSLSDLSAVWLNFSGNELVGTPGSADAGTSLTLRVTATDMGMLTAHDDFIINTAFADAPTVTLVEAPDTLRLGEMGKHAVLERQGGDLSEALRGTLVLSRVDEHGMATSDISRPAFTFAAGQTRTRTELGPGARFCLSQTALLKVAPSGSAGLDSYNIDPDNTRNINLQFPAAGEQVADASVKLTSLVQDGQQVRFGVEKAGRCAAFDLTVRVTDSNRYVTATGTVIMRPTFPATPAASEADLPPTTREFTLPLRLTRGPGDEIILTLRPGSGYAVDQTEALNSQRSLVIPATPGFDMPAATADDLGATFTIRRIPSAHASIGTNMAAVSFPVRVQSPEGYHDTVYNRGGPGQHSDTHVVAFSQGQAEYRLRIPRSNKRTGPGETLTATIIDNDSQNRYWVGADNTRSLDVIDRRPTLRLLPQGSYDSARITLTVERRGSNGVRVPGVRLHLDDLTHLTASNNTVTFDFPATPIGDPPEGQLHQVHLDRDTGVMVSSGDEVTATLLDSIPTGEYWIEGGSVTVALGEDRPAFGLEDARFMPRSGLARSSSMHLIDSRARVTIRRQGDSDTTININVEVESPQGEYMPDLFRAGAAGHQKVGNRYIFPVAFTSSETVKLLTMSRPFGSLAVNYGGTVKVIILDDSPMVYRVGSRDTALVPVTDDHPTIEIADQGQVTDDSVVFTFVRHGTNGSAVNIPVAVASPAGYLQTGGSETVSFPAVPAGQTVDGRRVTLTLPRTADTIGTGGTVTATIEPVFRAAVLGSGNTLDSAYRVGDGSDPGNANGATRDTGSVTLVDARAGVEIKSCALGSGSDSVAFSVGRVGSNIDEARVLLDVAESANGYVGAQTLPPVAIPQGAEPTDSNGNPAYQIAELAIPAYGAGDTVTASIRQSADYLVGSMSACTVVVPRSHRDPVVVGRIPDQTAREDKPFNYGMEAGVFTTEFPPLAYGAVMTRGGLDEPLPGWLAFAPDRREFSGTPANGDVGSINIKVTATDGAAEAGSSNVNFTLTVLNTNDAPVLAEVSGADQMVTEAGGTNNAVTGDPAAGGSFSLSDVDPNAMLTIQGRVGTSGDAWMAGSDTDNSGEGTLLSGTYGSFYLKAASDSGGNITATWTYQLDDDAAETEKLTPASTGIEDVFSFRIDDGTADMADRYSSTITLSIAVTGANDAPRVDPNITVTVPNATEDTLFSYSLPSGVFFDVDEGDTPALTAQVEQGGSFVDLSATPPTPPVWLTFDGSSFGGTPLDADGGKTFTVRVIATDTGSPMLTASRDLTITVDNTNDAPVLAEVSGADQMVTEAGGVANATTGDPAAGGSFTLSDVDASPMLTIQGRAGTSGNAWMDGSDTANGNKGTQFPGIYGSFYLKAASDSGGSITATWTYQLDDDDPDTQQLTPASTNIRDSFTFRIDDNTADMTTRYSNTVTLSIAVTGANDAPEVDQGIADTSVDEDDTTFAYSVPNNAFSDIDTGDRLTFTAQVEQGGSFVALSAAPSVWLTFDGSLTTEQFGGTPRNADVGMLTVRVIATDSGTPGLTISDDFTITVSNTNDRPTAVLDENRTGEDVTLNVPASGVLDNDTDPDPGGKASLSVNGYSKGGTLAASPTPAGTAVDGDWGELLLNADGGYTYTPGNAADAIPEGDEEEDVFTYRVTDGTEEDTTTLTITIDGANDAPEVDQGIDNTGATEDMGFTYSVPNNAFSDIDMGDTPTFTAQVEQGGSFVDLAPMPSASPVWLTFDGSLSMEQFGGTPRNADVGMTLTVRVTATDSGTPGLTAVDDFTITVDNTNDAPVLAEVSGADQMVTEAGGVANATTGDPVARGSFTLSDVDASPMLTIQGRAGTSGNAWMDGSDTANGNKGTQFPGTYGSFYLKAASDSGGSITATWTYQLDDDDPDTQQLAPASTNIRDSFTFRIDDGTADMGTRYSNIVTLSIAVTGANDAPTVDQGIADTSVDEDTTFAYPVPNNAFSDIDMGDTPTLTAQVQRGGVFVDLSTMPLPPSMPSEPPVWLTFDGSSFGGTPLDADGGKTFTVRVTATDSGGLTAVDDFIITVNNTNDRPTAVLDENRTGEDVTLDVPARGVLDNDTDPDPGGKASLSVNGYSKGSALAASPTPAGTAVDGDWGELLLNADGGYTYTPGDAADAIPEGDEEEDVFTYRVTDGTEEDTTTLTITIEGANDAPEVDQGIDNTGATEDMGFTYSVPNNAFSDIDMGDTPTFTAQVEQGGSFVDLAPMPSASPVWLTFDGSLSMEQFGGTPRNADVGMTLTVRVTATDSGTPGLTAVDDFTITVDNTNDAPVLAEVSGADKMVTEAGGVANATTGDPVARGSFTLSDVDASPMLTIQGRAGTSGNAWMDGSDTANGNKGTQFPGIYGNFYLKAASDSGGSITATWTYQLDDDDPDTQQLAPASMNIRDSFTFRIDDGTADMTTRYSNIVTLSIAVTGANDAPTVDQGITAPPAVQNADYNFTIPANAFGDVDESDTLSYTMSGAPGWLMLDTNTGQFGGSPRMQADVTTTTITVTATDSGGLAIPTTFDLTVRDTNDPPMAVLDANRTGEDVTLNVPARGVLSNDKDPDGVSTLVVSGYTTGSTYGTSPTPTGDALPGMYGILIINSNGSYTYTPGDAADAIPHGESRTDTFTYEAYDGVLEDHATLTITIDGANDAPEVDQGIANTSATEDMGFTYSVPNNAFSDIDMGDRLTFKAQVEQGGSFVDLAPMPSASSVWLTFDGSLTTEQFGGTPRNADVGMALTVRVTATDSGTPGLTAVDDFTITVGNTNDGPTAVLDENRTGEDVTLNVPASGVLDNDTDPDPGGKASLSVNGYSKGSALAASPTPAGTAVAGDWGELLLNADGGYTYTPGDAADAIPEGDEEEDVFTYRMTDGTEEDTTTLTITIDGANDAPEVDQGIANTSATEDMGFTYSVPNNAFSDIDMGDTPTFTAQVEQGGSFVDLAPTTSASPVWLTFDGSLNMEQFGGTPRNEDVGMALTVRVTATDSGGLTAHDDFTITVGNTNDRPTAVLDENRTGEDVTLNVPASGVLDNDTDPDPGGKASLSVNGYSKGSALAASPTPVGTAVDGDWGELLLNADGGYTYTPGNAADAIPEGDEEEDVFTYRVTDGMAEDTTTLTITIDGANDAPEVDQGIADTGATEDMDFTYSVPNNAFSDIDMGDTPTFTAQVEQGGSFVDLAPMPSASPVWLTFDSTTEQFGGTPRNADVGMTLTVRVTATDSGGLTTHDDFNITVGNTNDAPVLAEVSGADQMVTEAGGVANATTGDPAAVGSFTLSDVDPNAMLTIQGRAGTSGNAWMNGSDTASGNKGTQFSGIYGNFYLKAASDSGGSITATWTYQLDDDDPDTQQLAPASMNIRDSFTFRIDDNTADMGTRYSDIVTISIAVTGANDAPEVDQGIADTSVDEDTTFAYPVPDDAFSDIDTGDRLTFKAQVEQGGSFVDLAPMPSASPVWLTFDSTTEQFGGTPSNEDVGVTLTVRVTATDTSSQTAHDDFTITVGNTNDRPTAVLDENRTGEDVTLDVPASGVLDNDTDPDPGGKASLSVNGYSKGSALAASPTPAGTAVAGDWGELSLKADGSYIYTPGDAADVIPEGDEEEDVFTYRVTDGMADDTTTLTITIEGANDAPEVDQGIADTSATEDMGFTYSVPNNAFSDIDMGDRLTFKAQVEQGGSFVDLASTASASPVWLTFDGSLNTEQFGGTPSNADVGVTLTVRVTATDMSSQTTHDDFTITVGNTNDAPEVDQGIADTGATEDMDFTYSVPDNAFRDIDTGDRLTFTAQVEQGGSFVDLASTASASPVWLTFDGSLSTEQFGGTPRNADVGVTLTVRVIATDSGGLTAVDDFTITVGNTNDRPTAVLDENRTGEDATLNVLASGVLDNDTDPDPGGKASLSVNGYSKGSALAASPTPAGMAVAGDWGKLLLNADGGYTYTPGDAADAIPEGDEEEDVFTYRVTDGMADDTTTLTITIDGANDAPEVDQGIADTGATEDMDFTYSVPDDAFSDIDMGDTLTFKAQVEQGGSFVDLAPMPSASPVWLTFDSTTGQFGGTPSNADVGVTLTVRVIATDSGGLTTHDDFTITVGNTNDAPEVDQGIADTSATEDSPFTYSVPDDAFRDIDTGDRLTFTAQVEQGGSFVDLAPMPSASPVWLTFDGSASTEQFGGTPRNADVGMTLTVRVTATDTSSQTAHDDFTITVSNTNDRPTAVLDENRTGEDDTLEVLTQGILVLGVPISGVLSNDTDPDPGGKASLSVNGYSKGSALAASPTPAGTAVAGDWGELLLNADGGYTYTPGDAADAIPDGGEEEDVFTYRVTDGMLMDETTLTITIDGANDAPEKDQGIGDARATEGRPFSYRVPDNAFRDIDTGDSLTFTAQVEQGGSFVDLAPLPSASPVWLTFDSGTERFGGTPSNADVGMTLTVRVTATDTGTPAQAAIDTFTLTVTADPRPIIEFADAAATDAEVMFILDRHGGAALSMSSSLNVNMEVASPNNHVEAGMKTLTFGAGESRAEFTMLRNQTTISETGDTVTASLRDSGSYRAGASDTMSVVLTDVKPAFEIESLELEEDMLVTTLRRIGSNEDVANVMLSLTGSQGYYQQGEHQLAVADGESRAALRLPRLVLQGPDGEVTVRILPAPAEEYLLQDGGNNAMTLMIASSGKEVRDKNMEYVLAGVARLMGWDIVDTVRNRMRTVGRGRAGNDSVRPPVVDVSGVVEFIQSKASERQQKSEAHSEFYNAAVAAEKAPTPDNLDSPNEQDGAGYIEPTDPPWVEAGNNWQNGYSADHAARGSSANNIGTNTNADPSPENADPNPENADQENLSPWRDVRFWASAKYGDMSFSPKSTLDIDGDLTSLALGMEKPLGANKLVGIAINWHKGKIDIDDRQFDIDGEIDLTQWTVAPYAVYSTSFARVWGTIGLGGGTLDYSELRGVGAAQAGNRATGSSNLTMALLAIGTEYDLVRLNSLSMVGRVEAVTSELRLDSDKDDLYSGQDMRTHGLRSEVEFGWTLVVESVQIHPHLTGGYRWDGGDGTTGGAFEYGGGLDMQINHFSFSGSARRQGTDSKRDYDLSSYTVEVSYGQGNDGRGLNLNVQNTVGDFSRMDPFAQDVSWAQSRRGGSSGSHQTNVSAGYGFAVGKGLLTGNMDGLLTPYLKMDLDGGTPGQWSLGLTLENDAVNIDFTHTIRQTPGEGDEHESLLRFNFDL